MAKSTQILDIDLLLPPKKTIKLFGESHEVKPMTANLFLESQRLRQSGLSEDGISNNNAQDTIVMMMDYITMFIPTLTLEVLGNLSIEQLTKIMDFINQVVDTNNDQTIPEKVKQEAKNKMQKSGK